MRRSLIKDGDPDSYSEYGIPAGPPDMEMLDWEEVKREISNALAKQGLFTLADIGRNETAFMGAVNILRRYLIWLYREEDRIRKAK